MSAAARAAGLKVKIHATNSFRSAGHVAESGRHVGRAPDRDHRVSGSEDRRPSPTRGNLPGVPFFLMMEKRAPARKLIDAGAAVALASDFNPGSSSASTPCFLCCNSGLHPEADHRGSHQCLHGERRRCDRSAQPDRKPRSRQTHGRPHLRRPELRFPHLPGRRESHPPHHQERQVHRPAAGNPRCKYPLISSFVRHSGTEGRPSPPDPGPVPSVPRRDGGPPPLRGSSSTLVAADESCNPEKI